MIFNQCFLTGIELWCYETLLCLFLWSQFPNISAAVVSMSGFQRSHLRQRRFLAPALVATARIGIVSVSTRSRPRLEK